MAANLGGLKKNMFLFLRTMFLKLLVVKNCALEFLLPVCRRLEDSFLCTHPADAEQTAQLTTLSSCFLVHLKIQVGET